MALKGVLSDKNVPAKLAVWLGLILVLTVVTVMIWATCVHSTSVGSMRALQAIQTFSVFILPTLAAVYLWSEMPLSWLRLDHGMSWQLAVLVPLTIIVLAPGINLLSDWNQHFSLPSFLADWEARLQAEEEKMRGLTEMLAQADSVPEWVLNVVIMALLPAVGEELCFRGTCQGLIESRSDCGTSYGTARLQTRTHVAVWVTAIIFSGIHFQFYGFVPRMLLGAVLGYLLCWTGSLYVPMLAHFTNNAIAVTCYFIAGKGIVRSEVCDSFGTGETAWVGGLSLAVGLALLWLIRRIAVRPQSSGLPL